MSVRHHLPTIVLLGFLGSCFTFGAAGNRCQAEELNRLRPSRVIDFKEQRDREKPSVMTGVAMSPDGMFIAAAGDDHLIRIWNRETGKLLHRLSGHKDWIRTIAFSPDGKTLVSAGNDRFVLFWDVKKGEKLRATATTDAAICKVVYDHAGKRIAVVGFDQTLNVYEAATCKRVQTLECASCDLRAVAFSPDGKRLASAGREWDDSRVETSFRRTGTRYCRRPPPHSRFGFFTPAG